MNNSELENMSSNEFELWAVKSNGLLLPLGSTEITGTHAPLGTDNLVAKKVMPLLAQKTGCITAPLIPYGDTLELPPRAGTVHIPEQALREFYLAVCRSFLKTADIKKLFFVNFHSLNSRAADSACRILKNEGACVFTVDWWKAASIQAKDILTDKKYGTGHGGEMITSVLLACAPQALHIEKETNSEPKEAFEFYAQNLYNSGSPFLAYGNFSDYCEQSAWGKLTHASTEKGQRILDKTIQCIADFIHEACKTL